MFEKVLVANRGEIAVRVIRALREAGVRPVAVYSDADRAALHVRLADEAARLGPAPATESYLDGGKLIEAALRHGAQAIHPGYGFLSENAQFARACRDAGLVFIGPPVEAIERMGSKLSARRLAEVAGVPVVPGTLAPVASLEEARAAAREFGYPVLLKASAGGGGKGMRQVASEQELASALREAASESERAFHSAEVYIEKALERPRHIEIQVIGDHHGNLIHLGERECSLQRRHQKLAEESPSPLAVEQPGLRESMGEAAVRLALAAGYANAGTCEFLVDRDGRYYFLEMNTRLQVEHPVTELVTGLDLVHLQLEVAAGATLGVRQQDVRWRGSAIEARIYAEDPARDFFPSPGRITWLREPSGPGVRLDSGIYAGFEVPLEYDPLLAKLAVWGETRAVAIRRMLRALGEYSIGGVETTVGFFRRLFADPEFARGELDTGFLPRFFERQPPETQPEASLAEIAALIAACHASSELADSAAAPPANHGASGWRSSGRRRQLR